MAKLVAKTYATALFELAKEKHRLEEILQEVTSLTDNINQNKDFIKVLTTPKMTKEAKIAFVEQCFKGEIDDSLLGLLVVMITKDRVHDIVEAFEYFSELVLEEQKKANAFITTAIELKESQKDIIKNRLLETTKKADIRMTFNVDETILGGMIIRIGDRVIDNSIQGKMDTLKRELIGTQLG